MGNKNSLVWISETCNMKDLNRCSHIVFLDSGTTVYWDGPRIWNELLKMPRSKLYYEWRSHFERYEFYQQKQQKSVRVRAICCCYAQ